MYLTKYLQEKDVEKALTKFQEPAKLEKPRYDYATMTEPTSPCFSQSHFQSHFSSDTKTIPNPKNISIMNVNTDRMFPINLAVDDYTASSPKKQ